MSSSLEKILRIFADLLPEIVEDPPTIPLRVQAGPVEVVYGPCRSEYLPPVDEAPPSGRLFVPPTDWPDWADLLTALEERLLRVASVEDYEPAAVLAKKANSQQGKEKYQATLCRLVEVRLMESAPGKGYRIKPPPPGKKLPAWFGSGLTEDQQAHPLY
jgi:hypothetical protein